MKSFILIANFAACMITPQIAIGGGGSITDLSKLASFDTGIRAVSASLLDQGDYFLSPSGQKIKFYRKKDVFAVRSRSSDKNRALQRFQNNYGNRVESVRQHQLGHYQVVRIDNSVAAKQSSQQSFTIQPEMLAALDSTIINLTPVFANAQGQGDSILLPKFIVKVRDGHSTRRLGNLLRRLGLEVDRRLRTSGVVLSVSLKNASADEGRIFELARILASNTEVDWAQPQFLSRPFKTSYLPDDPLIDQQWHLRNTGLGGSRCDTDCDANNAWNIDADNSGTGDQGIGAVTGSGRVIAVIDDGVQLDHADLDIWQNGGETGLDSNNNDKRTNGIDDDDNGYVDDWRGWDFVQDNSSVAGSCGEDAIRGQDNDPSPQATTDCSTANGDLIEQDNHGTAVAGIVAAKGDNAIGVAGIAYRAKVLPIRAISAFSIASESSFCTAIVEAMSYAGRYADVINNSWRMVEGTCPALDIVIAEVVSGTQQVNSLNVSARPNLGSPVIFSSGNNASGWVKVSVPVSAGKHAYEWRLLRSDFPADFDEFAEHNSVWLDDIRWPDGSTEGFEAGLAGFTTNWQIDSCNQFCEGVSHISAPIWTLESNPEFVHSGSASARVVADLDDDCTNSYLHTIRDGRAGTLSFWLWVSTDTQTDSDKFEFLVDGEEVISYGDLPRVIDNEVAYPANLPSTIAVGSSSSGDLSGNSLQDVTAEGRASYSQFGTSLDLLAPSSDQYLGITTTDRSGTGDGYNVDGVDNDLGSRSYTRLFGGTSASAPIIAGIAASMIAVNPTLSADQIRRRLRQSADKTGTHPYIADGLAPSDGSRNRYHGYGRANMFRALQAALELPQMASTSSASCNPDSFAYTRENDRILPLLSPQISEFCPALGSLPRPEDGDICFPVPAKPEGWALICV